MNILSYPSIPAVLRHNARRYAKKRAISYIDIEDLANNQHVKALFEKRIAELNKDFPSYKTIKYFSILPREFSIEGGELTPTLKLKRKVIYEKYKDIIDEMYVVTSQCAIGRQTRN